MKETQIINETKHEVLKYVGGLISPEMECPKLLWLKTNLPDSWKRTARFLDLADYLTYRATGDDTRSLCTVVCKWTFQSHRRPEIQSPTNTNGVWGWDETFFRQIGLGDLADEDWIRIGQKIGPMGQCLAAGLTPNAARDLGLLPGTSVGIGIIDAHAGGIGTLGAKISTDEISPDLMEERLALIAGTSACHMACSKDPLYIDGIWGPYQSAMIPGMWLTEGGQSAVGALLDHVVHSHVLFPDLQKMADSRQTSIYTILNEILEDSARKKGISHSAELTREIHVLPDFHGNRSPRADPMIRGMISGLNLSADMEHLALVYLATLQAICLGTRHILGEMNARGYRIKYIFLTGGLGKNSLFVREIADITNSTILIPAELCVTREIVFEIFGPKI
jgi:FGGY-family pentulose kinase